MLVQQGYNVPPLPNTLVYEQDTNFSCAVLRPILAGGATEENLAKASALTKQQSSPVV